MKMKRLLVMVLLGMMSVFLVSCGTKSAEDVMKSELKDSYTGYSKVYGYDSLVFSEGGSTLSFDKKAMTITNGEEKNYFKVIPEKKLKGSNKGIFTKYESELKGKDYFIITVDYRKNDVAFGSQLYVVVLTDAGKTIRIFEFEDGNSDAYYDFKGKAD